MAHLTNYYIMKKFFYSLFILTILSGCTTNDFNNSNPNIPNYSFTVDLNLSLPSYSNLTFAGNAIYYANVGAKGIYVFNTGSGYNAFDAACPNQALNSCKTMTLNGINVVCPCDESEYSLFTGLGKLEYPLKQYRTELNGNVLRVYN